MELFPLLLMSADNPTLFEAISGVIVLFGTHAARPTATVAPLNALYFETDTGEGFQNQSGTWVKVADSSGGGGGAVDSVAGTAPISVDTPTGDVTVSHDDSGATPGSYGDATHVAQITVDATGHITDVADVAISGGGGGGLVLVEHKTVTTSPGVTTVTFSGLDGDTDGLYLLKGRLKNGAAADTLLSVRPNGSSSNLSLISHYWNSGGAAQAGGSDWYWLQAANGSGSYGDMTICARKIANSVAQPRYAFANLWGDPSGVVHGFSIAYKWNDTTNNLTSLDVTANQTNGIGDGSEFWLYKYEQ